MVRSLQVQVHDAGERCRLDLKTCHGLLIMIPEYSSTEMENRRTIKGGGRSMVVSVAIQAETDLVMTGAICHRLCGITFTTFISIYY